MDLKFPVTIVDTEVLNKDSLEKLIRERIEQLRKKFKELTKD